MSFLVLCQSDQTIRTEGVIVRNRRYCGPQAALNYERSEGGASNMDDTEVQ